MAKKLLVLKIGSSTLTAGTDRISYAKIEDIARQIIALRDKFYVILVSSGAIATARQFVDVRHNHDKIVSKQGLAAIGQPMLMGIYNEVFSSFGLKVAQCLLIHRDFQNETSITNIRNTINNLLDQGYTPIINENDTVATEEIVFGDNDELSAMISKTLQADLLVLASDVNGLYDKNPFLNDDAKLISEVDDIETGQKYIEDKESDLGTGGMKTKFQAAAICKKSGIEMWVLNGNDHNFLINAIENKSRFTRFL